MSKHEERGTKAAQDLIAGGDKENILKNYGYSRAAPDQTDFDLGYQRVIRDWMRNEHL